MVKGTARQVVLVKAPDTRLFEQAIFILREDALEDHGLSEDEIMRQAQKTAGAYVSAQLPNTKRGKLWLQRALWVLLGAVVGVVSCLAIVL